MNTSQEIKPNNSLSTSAQESKITSVAQESTLFSYQKSIEEEMKGDLHVVLSKRKSHFLGIPYTITRSIEQSATQHNVILCYQVGPFSFSYKSRNSYSAQKEDLEPTVPECTDKLEFEAKNLNRHVNESIPAHVPNKFQLLDSLEATEKDVKKTMKVASVDTKELKNIKSVKKVIKREFTNISMNNVSETTTEFHYKSITMNNSTHITIGIPTQRIRSIYAKLNEKLESTWGFCINNEILSAYATFVFISLVC